MSFSPKMNRSAPNLPASLRPKLAELAVRRQGRRTGLLIGEINNAPAREHFNWLPSWKKPASSYRYGHRMRRLTPMVPTRDAENSPDDADNDLSETA